MDIKNLSIADLKAAFDFVTIDLQSLKAKAVKDKISVEQIPDYAAVKALENKLHDELLNITRGLL